MASHNCSNTIEGCHYLQRNHLPARLPADPVVANEFTFCALAAPFAPAVPGLVQMAPLPVPCQQPIPTPLSPAARRPACQAHIQRSCGFDTSTAAACQNPSFVYKLCKSEGGICTDAGSSNSRSPQPAAQAATSTTSLENTVGVSGPTAHGSLPPVLLSDTLLCQRHPLSHAQTAVDYKFQRPRSLHATVLLPRFTTYCNLSSGAFDTTQ